MQKFSLSLISVALLGIPQMGFANTTADSVNLSKAQCLALKEASIFDTQIQHVECQWRSAGR